MPNQLSSTTTPTGASESASGRNSVRQSGGSGKPASTGGARWVIKISAGGVVWVERCLAENPYRLKPRTVTLSAVIVRPPHNLSPGRRCQCHHRRTGTGVTIVSVVERGPYPGWLAPSTKVPSAMIGGKWLHQSNGGVIRYLN